MLAPLIIFYLMCMPMGYIVGLRYQQAKVDELETPLARERVEKDYAFMPIACALFLPLAVVMAISEIMKGL